MTPNCTLLACLELQDFGKVVILVIVIVILVTGGKQSQLLVFWTWLGLEIDNKYGTEVCMCLQWKKLQCECLFPDTFKIKKKYIFNFQ